MTSGALDKQFIELITTYSEAWDWSPPRRFRRDWSHCSCTCRSVSPGILGWLASTWCLQVADPPWSSSPDRGCRPPCRWTSRSPVRGRGSRRRCTRPARCRLRCRTGCGGLLSKGVLLGIWRLRPRFRGIPVRAPCSSTARLSRGRPSTLGWGSCWRVSFYLRGTRKCPGRGCRPRRKSKSRSIPGQPGWI